MGSRTVEKRSRPTISIVTTMYKSAPFLREFFQRARVAVEQITPFYEFVFVNDGSPDESLDVARSFVKGDGQVKVVNLSRNFGHHKAMLVGLEYAINDYVFLIDCDLEEAPELLKEFFGLMEGDPSIDVVFGVQRRRKGKISERISGALFYWLLNSLTDFKIPRNFLTVRLMRRDYVKALLEFPERTVNFSTLTVLAGYRQVPVQVLKQDKGNTVYTWRRKGAVLVEAITSSSSKPLWMIFYAGVLSTGGVAIYCFYLMIRYFLYSQPPSGWTSIVVSIWLFGGGQLIAIGIMSLYVSRIFEEVKVRPRVLVREVIK